MPHVPDSALIEKMMAGDESALSTLYDRYSAMLFGLLTRILQDRHAAEEVLQDLFCSSGETPISLIPVVDRCQPG